MGRRETKRKSRSDPKTYRDRNAQINHSRPPPDQTFHALSHFETSKINTGRVWEIVVNKPTKQPNGWLTATADLRLSSRPQAGRNKLRLSVACSSPAVGEHAAWADGPAARAQPRLVSSESGGYPMSKKEIPTDAIERNRAWIKAITNALKTRGDTEF
jgi:hypothetical protein